MRKVLAFVSFALILLTIASACYGFIYYYSPINAKCKSLGGVYGGGRCFVSGIEFDIDKAQPKPNNEWENYSSLLLRKSPSIGVFYCPFLNAILFAT